MRVFVYCARKMLSYQIILLIEYVIAEMVSYPTSLRIDAKELLKKKEIVN